MSCTEAYATAQEFATFWKVACATEEQEVRFNAFLEIAASDIHLALAAVNACNCTVSDAGQIYLKKLNIVDAAVMFRDSCHVKMSDEQQQLFLEWVTTQLTNIRESKIELCAGETGADFPAIGWATPVKTEFQAAEVVLADIMKQL